MLRTPKIEFLWQTYSLDQIFDQLFGNIKDFAEECERVETILIEKLVC